jgi:hypothetical protein
MLPSIVLWVRVFYWRTVRWVEAFFCRLPSGEECYTHFRKTVLLLSSAADIFLSVRKRNEAASLQIKVL